MLAMNRLPSNSLLPSGGFDSHDSFDRSMSPITQLHGHSSSVISPLSLPHSVKQTSYFPDTNSSKKLSSWTYTHSQSSSGTPNSRQYLSPNQNASSRPPLSSRSSSMRVSPGSVFTSPTMAAQNPGSTSPLEHLSPHSTAALLQNREVHARRLQENWQVERAYLEASRTQAEEMLEKERLLMDEERALWIDQHEKLEGALKSWQQRAMQAESEVIRLTHLVNTMRTGADTHDQKHGGSSSARVQSPVGNRQTVSSGSSGAASGQSTGTFQTPSDGVSPGSLPPGKTVPESNPFEPLDPLMQRPQPENLSPTQERVPSIDIREVIPGLEGVRLRVPAIQKETFGAPNPSSPIPNPDRWSHHSLPNQTQEPTDVQSKASPAVERAKEALKAPEDSRRTVNAGHTPNHSVFFSRIPTVDSTAVNTAGSSGSSTPTRQQEQNTLHNTEGQNQSESAALTAPSQEASFAELGDDDELAERALLEPSDCDVALQGPLCLKNRPAADEIFLRRLSDKLEEVRASDATPSVLVDLAIPEIPDTSPAPAVIEPSASRAIKTNDDNRGDSMEDVEMDIPLVLKKSSNFGLPLGQLGASSS